MGIIIASILTIFLNKRGGSNVLAILLVSYLSFVKSLSYFNSVSFIDYVQMYSLSTALLCFCLFIYTKKTWKQFLMVFLTVSPQVYYLMVLWKPYLFSEYIPLWWWLNVDKLFIYSVFLLCYEQSMDFRFGDMSFRECMLNIAITLFLILF